MHGIIILINTDDPQLIGDDIRLVEQISDFIESPLLNCMIFNKIECGNIVVGSLINQKGAGKNLVPVIYEQHGFMRIFLRVRQQAAYRQECDQLQAKLPDRENDGQTFDVLILHKYIFLRQDCDFFSLIAYVNKICLERSS